VGYTVLVTGATGKTGRPLIPRLVARGIDVRAANRHPVRAEAGVEPVRFDWSDESTYAVALKGADAVYLVAPDPYAHVAELLDTARSAGVRRIVFLSAFGVEQTPAEDPLRRLEILVEGSGIPATILRPGAFMQNFSEPHWSHLDVSIRERDEFALPGGGTATVSWLSTEDIAAVAAVALAEDGHEGAGYTLTGPEALTMAEVAGYISTYAGRPVRHVEADRESVHGGLLAAGFRSGFAAYAADLYVHALSSGAFGVVTDDIATVTGRPPTTFAEYAAGAADAWRR
jgi:uncharacterized protein YbjT (DUF2867 family)